VIRDTHAYTKPYFNIEQAWELEYLNSNSDEVDDQSNKILYKRSTELLNLKSG
jgi:hypothetical protein